MSLQNLTDVNLPKSNTKFNSMRLYDLYLDGDIHGITFDYVESVQNSGHTGMNLVDNTDPKNPIVKTINKANNNGVGNNNINIYGLSSDVDTSTRLLVGQGSKGLDYTDDYGNKIDIEYNGVSLSNVINDSIQFTRTGICTFNVQNFDVNCVGSDIAVQDLTINGIADTMTDYQLTYNPSNHKVTYHNNRINNFYMQNLIPISRTNAGALHSYTIPGSVFKEIGQGLKFNYYCSLPVTTSCQFQIQLNGSQITNLAALTSSLHYEIEFNLFYVDDYDATHGKFFHQSKSLSQANNANVGVYGPSTELLIDLSTDITIILLLTDIGGNTLTNYYSRVSYI